MPDESNLKPEKQPSPVGDETGDTLESLSDSERRAKYGSNGSRKVTQSKREMMEALSRERFPWDD
jgi:hypothetical protein